MIPSVRCFTKRVDGGANVERDASIGVGQSNGRRGHEDEGESVLFLQLWEPPAIAIGVATEKVGSKSSDLEVGTLSRDRRRKLAQGLSCRSSRRMERDGTVRRLYFTVFAPI